MQSDPFIEMSAAELLGPLNDVERKFAPSRLFVAGDAKILNAAPRVSIVGSRRASSVGRSKARKLSRLICERQGVVVSGLARGIDTAAHQAAIEAHGKTVAVIGTPLDRCYPAENAGLQRQIMREHLCVSQFPAGYPIRPQNFPIRNRTMALLSDATVIVEAGEKSGSISQGWEALRLGRGLFICKALTEQALNWPREMLEYGARILADEEIDEFFECLPQEPPRLEFSEFSL